MGVLIFFVSAGVVAFFIVRGRRERDARRTAAQTTNLEADSWGVKRWLADGRYEEVGWSEIHEVRAVTLPKGPWDSRVRLVLDGGGERGCIVPIEVAEEYGLIAALGRLSGFDFRRLAEILDQERTGTEVLWGKTST